MSDLALALWSLPGILIFLIGAGFAVRFFFKKRYVASGISGALGTVALVVLG